MSRRIETGTAASAPPAPPQVPADDYLARLLKYIPAEIVGLYMTGAHMVSPDPAAPSYPRLWIVFAVCFFLVPLYFLIATTREGKPPLWPQIVLGTVAYPAWVFGIGGPFRSFSWYGGEIAAFVLAAVTLGIAWYAPPKGS
ncbi:MAG: hypothetical protein ACE15B_20070 [Bryobacteraceae bacterium]